MLFGLENNLGDHLKTDFALTSIHKIADDTSLDNMLPYERRIRIHMLSQHLENLRKIEKDQELADIVNMQTQQRNFNQNMAKMNRNR